MIYQLLILLLLCPAASADRRVFMWMWGTPDELDKDASIAASHNASITDVVLECGHNVVPPPFLQKWANATAKCEQPARVLLAAGIRVWLTLEPTESMNAVPPLVRSFWSSPGAVLPALQATAKTLGASGWNLDFECDGTPDDFQLYLSFLDAVRAGFGDRLDTLVDGNGDGCTADYAKMSKSPGGFSGLVLDMTTYYVTWPDDWQRNLSSCVESAGPGSCMPGLACYKKWSEEEVRAKVLYAAAAGAQQIGIFTLTEQDAYPEVYWWPILEEFLSCT